MSERFYITTAIAYASRKPHFGNTYEIIMTDAIARYKRARGYDVYFCTGTDEHGQKIEELANAAGITVAPYANKINFYSVTKTLCRKSSILDIIKNYRAQKKPFYNRAVFLL